jgi:hypothetical protein
LNDFKKELSLALISKIEVRQQRRRLRLEARRNLARVFPHRRSSLIPPSDLAPPAHMPEYQALVSMKDISQETSLIYLSQLDRDEQESETEEIEEWTRKENVRTLAILGDEIVLGFEVPDRLKSILAVGDQLRASLDGFSECTGGQQKVVKTRARTRLTPDQWHESVHLQTLPWAVDFKKYGMSIEATKAKNM